MLERRNDAPGLVGLLGGCMLGCGNTAAHVCCVSGVVMQYVIYTGPLGMLSLSWAALVMQPPSVYQVRLWLSLNVGCTLFANKCLIFR